MASEVGIGNGDGNGLRAIIAAAGLGSRLGTYTDGRPKCMVEVDGEPLVRHQLRALRSAGVEDIHIVRGYLGECIRAPDATFHDNPNFRDNNVLASLFSAREAMQGSFLTSYSDLLYRTSTVRAALEADAEIGLVVDRDWERVYEGRTDHPVEQAELVEVGDGSVRRVGKHVGPADAVGEFIGLAAFSERGGRLFRETYEDVERELEPNEPFHEADAFRNAYLTDLFAELLERGVQLEPVYIRGGWREIDTVQDLERARREWGDRA